MRELIFTRPAILWGLFAAALPVIIHLINRHRARRRPFAAIDFLFRVRRRSARRILLKQLLLLAIRTLLIVTLVLAAAGPLLRPSGRQHAPGPTSTALVIDASFSMRARANGTTRFEEALDRAGELVRGMGPGDAACLICAGSATRVMVEPCTDSPSVLLDAIADLRVEWGTSDLSAAMETAAGLLARAPGPNRRIVLLTDAAAHALTGSPVWPADFPAPQVLLHDLGRDRSRDNHAVLEVEQSNAGPYLEVSTRLVQHGLERLKDLPVEIELAGETAARGFVDLTPGKPVRKLFTVRPPDQRHTLGGVRLRPDQLPEDDQRPFLASGRNQLQALLVNGDMRPVLHRDEVFYLEHALAPSGAGASGIRFTTVTPDRLHEGLLESVQVVFLANVRELGPAVLAALSDFVAAGGGLFVSVGDQVDVDHSNQMLAGLLPFDLRDVVALGPADPDGVHRQGMAFGEFDDTHPALAIFGGERAQALAAVRTRRAVVLEPGRTAARGRVLIRYANGAPALVEGRHRAGRVILFTSSLDRDWTNWPARASFLPFLQHTAAYLAGSLDELPPPEVPVDGTVRIPLLPEADGVRIRLPDDGQKDLQAGDLIEGRAVFSDTRLPGWYEIAQTTGGRKLPGRTIPGFFVRLPPPESDLTPVTAEQLQALLGHSARLTVAGSGDPATRSRAGLLLLLALGLVFCEALLIRR